MTAEQGQAYAWTIEKSAEPGSLDFLNTCARHDGGSRSATVDITVTWTRSGPTASGDTTITTHVYATNPAHRTITVQATDNIYQGAGQAPADLLDTVVGSRRQRAGRQHRHAHPDSHLRLRRRCDPVQ